jgi:hypothetical protein
MGSGWQLHLPIGIQQVSSPFHLFQTSAVCPSSACVEYGGLPFIWAERLRLRDLVFDWNWNCDFPPGKFFIIDSMQSNPNIFQLLMLIWMGMIYCRRRRPSAQSKAKRECPAKKANIKRAEQLAEVVNNRPEPLVIDCGFIILDFGPWGLWSKDSMSIRG